MAAGFVKVFVRLIKYSVNNNMWTLLFLSWVSALSSCREFRRFAPSAGLLILVKMEEIRFPLRNVYAVQKPKRKPETEQQPPH
jgi:hypothetical protein